MNGNDDTIFLAEAQFWVNLSQEQKLNTRLVLVYWDFHLIILKNLYSHDFINPALDQIY